MTDRNLQDSVTAPSGIGSAEPVVVRDAADRDRAAILALAQSEDMGVLSTTEHTIVAEAADGHILGFLRPFSIGNNCYIFPIVVSPEARGRGIGRMLIEEALVRYPEMRLVSRGPVVPFYGKLGAFPVTWEEIDDIIASECLSCRSRGTCLPQPMIFSKTRSGAPSDTPES
ncbi:MAG: GNAT family N-acetyltransferase [Eggerthellaceae bacterium]|nr:GNAT family N-acetyltransferase [Eggerthellaceae bacterium]